jgi:hypothetical protein
VQGQASYSQCFTLVITEPKDLSLLSTINKSSNMLTLDLSGGNSYNVQLNGVTYTTTNNSITLPLSKGSNNLSVSTDKFCQGIIEKIINISGNKAPYPNPFQNILYLNLGDLGATSGTIKIYNIADGKLVLSKKYADQSGVMRLDVSSLDNGAYTLILVQDNTQTIFKIIKK